MDILLTRLLTKDNKQLAVMRVQRLINPNTIERRV